MVPSSSINRIIYTDGQKIFVSTVGDDSGDGSEEEPLRTLEKAIDVANEMREDSDKLIEILFA